MCQNYSIRLGRNIFCCRNSKIHRHILFSFIGSELDSHCACAITGSRRYCISSIVRRNRPLYIALYIERSRSVTSLCFESGSAYRELRTGCFHFLNVSCNYLIVCAATDIPSFHFDIAVHKLIHVARIIR